MNLTQLIFPAKSKNKYKKVVEKKKNSHQGQTQYTEFSKHKERKEKDSCY